MYLQSVVRGQGEAISPLPMTPCARQIVGLILPLSCLQGQFTHTPTNQVSSSLLPRQDAGPALLSAAFGGAQDQFSLVKQTLRAESILCGPILTVFSGYRSHRPQYRLRLQQGNGPRYGPGQQPRLRRHQNPKVTAQAAQICIPLVGAWPLGTNMALGASPESSHPCGA